MNSAVYFNIKSGIISGIFAVIIAISFASFMFIGDLQAYLPIGFGLAIVSANVLRLIIAKGSTIPGVVTSPFAVICIFNTLMITAIAHHLTQEGLTNQLLPTILALIVVSTLTSAATLAMIGYFKGGNLIRYFPYPVINGLLASISLLVFLGGIEIIAGKRISVFHLNEILTMDIMIQLAVGLSLAYFLVKTMAGTLSTLWICAVILVIGIVIFFTQYLKILPFPDSWFMNPIPHGRLYPPPVSLSDINLINWKAILGQYSYLITMNFLFSLSFLINFSGVEAFLRQDFNVNYELKLTGFANLITALFGGIAGCIACPQTIPNIQQGGTGYLSSITAAILGVILLTIDSFYLNYLPKIILAGVPMCLGLILLVDLVYKSRFRLPLIDYLLVLTIMLITLFFGFIYATLFGIVASALIFLVNYSLTDIVKYTLEGNAFLSPVERSLAEEEILAIQNEHIFILKLQGYIFFGSAYNLLTKIKTRLNETQKPKVKYLIIDFALVNGIDSSAVFCLSKIFNMSQKSPITVLICHTDEKQKHMLMDGESKEKNHVFKYFKSLDYAVEWCEEQFLKESTVAKKTCSRDHLTLFLQECEKAEFKKGEYIIEAGSSSNKFYYLISGKATAQIENESHFIRLKTLMPGTFVGELGFLTGVPRTTYVIAEEDSTLYLITPERLSEIESKNPKLLANFYREISVVLSERVINQNKIVELLTR